MKTHIISGKHRGKKLYLPEDAGVRPTKNRVLQAAFNMIESRINIQNAHVLDLFCGSGQWGLEALSRGAAHVEFVDLDTKFARQNTYDILGESDACKFSNSDLRHRFSPFHSADVLFGDPPYMLNLLENMLKHAHSLSHAGAIWALESEPEYDLESKLEATPLTLEKQKNYGKSTLWILRHN